MNQPNVEKSLFRSASRFFSGTLLSRISGLGREVVMAFCFGAHPAIAAFLVAFRFANLFRRLGEGGIAQGFIPHFEELRAASEKSGALFFRDLFYSLALFFILFSACVMGILYGVMHVGYFSSEMNRIFFLTLLMVPGILFISLYGLCGALLQSHGRFFSFAAAPIAANIVWIIALFCLKSLDPYQAVTYLALSILVAFAVQWLMTLFPALSHLKGQLSIEEKIRPQLFSSNVRRMLMPLLFSVVGIAATQINSIIDALFARFASLEGPAHLWYAIRLQQLPLSLFGVALSAALLPALSRANSLQYQQLLERAVVRSVTLIFPITLAILALGLSSVNLIYGRGHFTLHDTAETLLCLWGYGLGLLPSVLILLIVPAFYAKKEFRTPMIGSILALALNSCCNAFFVFCLGWGAFSIAVATSLSSWLNFFFLLSILRKTVTFRMTFILLSSLKTILCSLVGCAVALVAAHYLGDATLLLLQGEKEVILPRLFSEQLFHFGLLSLLFFGGTLGSAWIVRADELLILFHIKKKAAEWLP